MVATVGDDFDRVPNRLEERGVDTSAVRVRPDDFTATGFVTTDLDDNQIWAYYTGRHVRRRTICSLEDLPGPFDAVIVAPNDPN